MSKKNPRLGSLVIVGTGIQGPGHITLESRSYLQTADKLLYLVADPVTDHYLRKLNRTAEDLFDCYAPGKPRIDSYNEMVERILAEVRKGQRVCVAFYGHPGVFVYPSHQSIRRARNEGFRAIMLPAPSAEDCLFADLGMDPGIGCQTFEATSFLIRQPRFDTHSLLFIWQIGATGDLVYTPIRKDTRGLQVLTDCLLGFYEPNHQVIIYEASVYPTCAFRADTIPLKDLAGARVTGISTLVVPPTSMAPVNDQIVERLGLDRNLMGKAMMPIKLPGSPRPKSGNRPHPKPRQPKKAISVG
jgi:precorrin-6B methylase 1